MGAWAQEADGPDPAVGDAHTAAPVDVATLDVEDRWIISRLATTAKAVTAALEGYHFADVAKLVYEFTWSEFCDWYIEMSKGRLKKDEGGRMKDEKCGNERRA